MGINRSKVIEVLPFLNLDRLVERYPHWNFRCPICGDSKKDPNKRRGWIRKKDKKDEYYFKCFNCGNILSFPDFVKEVDEDVYHEYFKVDLKSVIKKFDKKEKINKIENNYKLPSTYPPSLKKGILKQVEKVIQPVSHYFKPIVDFKEPLEYIKKRKIPEEKYDKIYFYDKINTSFSNMIIFPFFYKNDLIYGFQGRYYKFKKFHTSIEIKGFKVYNIFDINYSKNVFVFESIIDSLFLDNSIAMLGADITKNILAFIPKDKIILVFDNDETGFKKSVKYFYEGYKIIIYPDNVRYKDLNEMIVDNYLNYSNVEGFFNENIYSLQDNRIEGIVKLKIKEKKYADVSF